MRNEPSNEETLILKHVQTPTLISWIEERLQRDGRLGINIGIQEGTLLQTFCSSPEIKKVIEIGTQYGCSASWMARGLGSRGKIYTFERDPQCIEESQKTFQHPEFLAMGCQVQSFHGDARGNLPKVEAEGPFDLVFIDANKSAYFDYLLWAQKNVRKGGLILVDNIYLFGTMFLDECPEKTPQKMWEVMKKTISEQFGNSGFSTGIIPTGEGLMVSCKL